MMSTIEHLQLFSEHFTNFATIWACCDVVIFLTFILFYKTHVLRQKHLYQLEKAQQARELERKKSRASKKWERSSIDISANHSSEQSSKSKGFDHALSKFRDSITGIALFRKTSSSRECTASNNKSFVLRRFPSRTNESAKDIERDGVRKTKYHAPPAPTIEEEPERERRSTQLAALPIPSNSCASPQTPSLGSPSLDSITASSPDSRTSANSVNSVASSDTDAASPLPSMTPSCSRETSGVSDASTADVRRRSKDSRRRRLTPSSSSRARSRERSKPVRAPKEKVRASSRPSSARACRSKSPERRKYGKRKASNVVKATNYTPKMTSSYSIENTKKKGRARSRGKSGPTSAARSASTVRSRPKAKGKKHAKDVKRARSKSGRDKKNKGKGKKEKEDEEIGRLKRIDNIAIDRALHRQTSRSHSSLSSSLKNLPGLDMIVRQITPKKKKNALKKAVVPRRTLSNAEAGLTSRSPSKSRSKSRSKSTQVKTKQKAKVSTKHKKTRAKRSNK